MWATIASTSMTAMSAVKVSTDEYNRSEATKVLTECVAVSLHMEDSSERHQDYSIDNLDRENL